MDLDDLQDIAIVIDTLLTWFFWFLLIILLLFLAELSSTKVPMAARIHPWFARSCPRTWSTLGTLISVANINTSAHQPRPPPACWATSRSRCWMVDLSQRVWLTDSPPRLVPAARSVRSTKLYRWPFSSTRYTTRKRATVSPRLILAISTSATKATLCPRWAPCRW